MGIGDELVSVIGADHYPCDGGHIAVGKPMLLGRSVMTLSFFEIFGSRMGDLERASAIVLWRAFDIGDLYSVIGKLDAPSCMAVKKVLWLFEELETDMVGVYRRFMWIGEEK